MPNDTPTGRALLVWFAQEAARAARQFGKDGGNTLLILPTGTWTAMMPRLVEQMVRAMPPAVFAVPQDIAPGRLVRSVRRVIFGAPAMACQCVLLDEDQGAWHDLASYQRVVAAGQARNLVIDGVQAALAPGGEAKVMTLLAEDTGS